MAQKHKHHDVIVAWAAGITCQYRQDGSRPWHDLDSKEDCPGFSADFEYRIKPEPQAKVYPVTGMSTDELYEIWRQPAVLIGAMTNIANAALRHAIDSGQLVEPNPSRDMAIAKAVQKAIFDAQRANQPTCDMDMNYIIATVKD